ncbi:acyltransferase family protein [Rhodococcus sp. NPDC127530]|uniref:acyltransferase family protein n=1 Tax=unclassified Rhodococcus (in: high G+C Gram-positive bacteria) TaxID=192944 RepID=UPI0036435340
MVTSLLPEPTRGRRRRKGQESKAHQRLDIQGLRMVAVMLVVLDHLFAWPRGGFIGVDVFFVISGFLITGSLMHTFEKTGRISFPSFYRRRIRRIVPAATLVLVVTVVAAYALFSESRFKSTALDAVSGFFFVSNWRFGLEGTDYFTAEGPVSPLQHYWSLSVEEQFYFVWPAVILAIGLVVSRNAWSKKIRLALSAGVMGVAVAGSFTYSVIDTASNPTWAYFSTFTRVWELGVGALMAITISYFDRIPDKLRPVIAWSGLAAILVGAFAITEEGGGFPAPWAAVPVVGAALIIGAGVSGQHRFLQILTNRVSTYVGDISYSLYLWHWPVIIMLGVLMDRGTYYFATALFLMFGLSIASYHFFENPIRASNWLGSRAEARDRKVLDVSRWRLPTLRMSESNQTIGLGSLVLITAGLVVYGLTPVAAPATPPLAVSAEAQSSATQEEAVGPAQAKLTQEIISAVQATSWTELTPSMDEAISGPQASDEFAPCGQPKRLSAEDCTWGAPTAPKTIVLLGDSVAMTYVEPLTQFAESSSGEWKVRVEAMFGCQFVDVARNGTKDAAIDAACPGHKDQVINMVNEIRPDVVMIANSYTSTDAATWTEGLDRLVGRFSANIGKLVMLSAPPADINIGDCYNRVNMPADCLSKVTTRWSNRAAVEDNYSHTRGGMFIDSRRWFCTSDGHCPSFVGTIPVKRDEAHMTPAYGSLISPAFAETLRSIGL